MTDSEEPLLSYLVGRLDRAIRNRLHELLDPFELSIPQFTTLSVLARRPGLSNAQLARRALILPQSMIGVIVGLEARDLVVRAPDPNHHRILQTRLTGPGQRLLDRAERATDELERQLVAAVGEDDDIERVFAVLQRWVNVLNGPGDSASGPRPPGR